MMKFPHTVTVLGLLVVATPLCAASPEGRSADLTAAILGVDIVPMVNVLPAAPVATLKMELASSPFRAEPVVLPELPAAQTPLADQLPIVGAVRHRTGDRFNTTDSSHPNDFALCYRLTPRMGLQVIPGDPTPANVKLPVSTMANNAGVTVGMTVRLGRSR